MAFLLNEFFRFLNSYNSLFFCSENFIKSEVLKQKSHFKRKQNHSTLKATLFINFSAISVFLMRLQYFFTEFLNKKDEFFDMKSAVFLFQFFGLKFRIYLLTIIIYIFE
jgi:hypothetical protein